MAAENSENSIRDEDQETNPQEPLQGTDETRYFNGHEEDEARGTWRHAAFHVATTIATPAAYAPLPFAVASLGWPLGNYSQFDDVLINFFNCDFKCSGM